MMTKSKAAGAGIWKIIDVRTDAVYVKFRARRMADVRRQLSVVSIGLSKPIEDLEAIFITEWEE
jgi:hypothetical protein